MLFRVLGLRAYGLRLHVLDSGWLSGIGIECRSWLLPMSFGSPCVRQENVEAFDLAKGLEVL